MWRGRGAIKANNCRYRIYAPRWNLYRRLHLSPRCNLSRVRKRVDTSSGRFNAAALSLLPFILYSALSLVFCFFLFFFVFFLIFFNKRRAPRDLRFDRSLDASIKILTVPFEGELLASTVPREIYAMSNWRYRRSRW
jgi:hypothetical protein